MLDGTTREIVERKLTLLVTYIDELTPLVGDTTRSASTANVTRRAIERLV